MVSGAAVGDWGIACGFVSGDFRDDVVAIARPVYAA